MARIRSIHPGFWTDDELVGCSIWARMLFLGLLTEADDKGAFEWKELVLKMRIFPADDANVGQLLRELQEAGKIAAYEMDGKKFGAIRNFCKFQRPKKPNDIHPMPDEFRTYVGMQVADAATVQHQFGTSSEPVRNQFGTSSEKSPQMEDGGGNKEEGERKKEAAKAASDFSPEPETTEVELYRRGAELFGKSSGGLITRARKSLGDIKSLALVIEAKGKHDPKSWFAGAVQRAERPPDAELLPGTWVGGERGARTF